jgi:MFS family permease
LNFYEANNPTAAGGVVFPFLMSSLLNKFGARTTLLAWSVALALLTAPLLFFLKPRIPLSQTTMQRPLSWTFLKTTTYWMLQLGNVTQSLGYLLPSTYLSSYAHSLGLPSIMGAILLALFSLASTPGGVVLGSLGDRLTPMTVILISSLGSALAVFLFWGLSTSIPILIVFSVVYGFFAGAFSSTYPAMMQEMKKDDENIDTGLVMGLLLGGRGLGFVIGGPVSDGLFKGSWSTAGKWGYNTEYGPIIVATGITALFGGWGWMWTMVKGVTW